MCMQKMFISHIRTPHINDMDMYHSCMCIVGSAGKCILHYGKLILNMTLMMAVARVTAL